MIVSNRPIMTAATGREIGPIGEVSGRPLTTQLAPNDSTYTTHAIDGINHTSEAFVFVFIRA